MWFGGAVSFPETVLLPESLSFPASGVIPNAVRNPRCGRRAEASVRVLNHIPQYTLFACWYSRTPPMPFSRPTPLSLKPPNGAAIDNCL